MRLVCRQVAVLLGEADSLNGGSGMRNVAVPDNITVDGVINGGEGWSMPCGAEEVDQSYVHEVVVP
jgi:hypothetical protein